jgi:hypothetical protein
LLYSAILNRIAEYSNSFCEYLQSIRSFFCNPLITHNPSTGTVEAEERGNSAEFRMKWIEIIRLRSSAIAPKTLKEFMSALANNRHPGLTGVRICRHAAWETDWSLHLQWESEKLEKNGSALGLRLGQALEEFGLVDHSVWIQEV